MAQPTTTRSVILVTTGEAGSGKTYVRAARFLVDVFLPDSTGVHYSNFPLGLVPDNHSNPPAFEGESFVDRIAARLVKQGHELDEVKSRVHLIPKAELDLWEAGTSGPWNYFSDLPLTHAHIAIDEIHNYVGPDAS